MLTCGELRAMLADSETYPDDLEVWVEMTGDAVTAPAEYLAVRGFGDGTTFLCLYGESDEEESE